MENGGVRSWLLNTFAVNNLINESHKLKRRILFEQIPSGQQYLTPLIEAMRDDLRVEITYHSFWRDEPGTYEIEPYCIKIFRQRWYVIARNPSCDAIRTYSLDRILDMQPTDVSFKMPKNFQPEHFFDNSFGIISDENIAPCPVEIKVWGNQRKYFNALPLHSSQTEITQTDEYSIFRYILRPTYDFRQELLSHGADLEVLSPEWFREELGTIVSEMNEAYNS
jgi:predicted DNA-binding transcriptional regulator YafY